MTVLLRAAQLASGYTGSAFLMREVTPVREWTDMFKCPGIANFAQIIFPTIHHFLLMNSQCLKICNVIDDLKHFLLNFRSGSFELLGRGKERDRLFDI